MRRTLGNVLSLLLVPALALGAAGCGGSGSDSAADSAADTASDSSPASGSASGSATDGSTAAPDGSASSAPVEATEIGVVSQTGAGGTVDEVAAVLQDRAAVSEFAEQFDGPALRKKIQRAVSKADVPQGQVVLGAVVALGCDVPPGVDVRRKDAQLLLVARPIKAPKQECLATMTSVGLVAVDADAL